MSCMTILSPNLKISSSDIRPHLKWAVSFCDCMWPLFSSSLVCVGMYWLTYFIAPEGRQYDRY